MSESERPLSERSRNKHVLMRPWEKPPQKVNKTELAGLVNAELYSFATAMENPGSDGATTVG